MAAPVVGLDVELDVPDQMSNERRKIINEMEVKDTIYVSLNGNIPRPLLDIIGSYAKEGLYLISKDGTRFRLLKSDAERSLLLQTVYTSDDGFLEIPLRQPSRVVSKIIEYLTERKQTLEWRNDYIIKCCETGCTHQILYLAHYLLIDL